MTANGSAPVSQWHVGPPWSMPSGRIGVVALNAEERDAAISTGRVVIGIHDALETELSCAPDIFVTVPAYRSKRFIPVLAWLASRLMRPDGLVHWRMTKQQGPKSVQRMLVESGWDLARTREDGWIILRGIPTIPIHLPRPHSFEARLGSRSLRLEADFGVFSPRDVDRGSADLLSVVLRRRPVNVVADVGIGYGPLALGLVANSIASRAVGSDVDAVALWLARRNATLHDLPVDVALEEDPAKLPPSELTVCNVPTHLNAHASARLMEGLTTRGANGSLALVVHASLETRYKRYLLASGFEVRRTPGSAHVVLET